MKKRLYILISCWAVLLILSSQQLQAQKRFDPIPCYQPKVSKEKIQQLIQSRQKAMANRSLSSSQKQLRVYFHICRNDNGGNPGATTADVDTEFQTLLNDYAGGNICFVKAGVNFIDNTTLNNINVDENDDAEDLFEARTIPGCLNVFFVYNIRGENNNSGGKIGGLAFDIPATMCLVGKDYLGRNTTSHEIGHCLGLFHTYDNNGFGDEFINGDDCAIRGDFICDTKADPYSYALDDCFSTNNGFYSGNCEDPAGKKNFSPPYNNIMSYWHHDPETFTSGQFTAMQSTIENDNDIEGTASPQSVTILPVTYLVEFVYKSAIDKLQTIGPVEFGALSNGGLFGSQVVLTPGFYAHPQILPLKIAATDCSTTSVAAIAKSMDSIPAAATPKTAAISNDNNKLLVYPNPATQYFDVVYSQPTMFDAIITIRNINGAVIFSSSKKNVLKLQERIAMTAKPKGIYFVQVNIGAKQLTAKVIVQ